MDHLPEHIQINILQNLSSNDLRSFLLVNSRFYEIITKNSCLNKKFILNLNQHFSSELKRKIIENYSTRKFVNVTLKWFTIYTNENWDETSKAKDLIEFFKIFGLHVEKFTMHGDYCFSLNFVRKILEQTPNIEHLVLRVIESKNKLESLTLNKLKYFAISSTSSQLDVIGSLLEKVRNLEYFKSSVLITKLFPSILMNQRNIKELHLTNFTVEPTSNDFRAELWMEFLARNKDIKVLEFNKIAGLTNDTVDSICKLLSNISNLNNI